MFTILERHSSRALKILLIFMVLYSVISLGRAVARGLGPVGGQDFHSYWYSGHFVRQGQDPYRAFFDREKPNVPINYLDGAVTRELPVARSGLCKTPANTAPLVLLLSLFSLFSWFRS